MGKVRKVQLGDESFEKEQRKKAEVRREAKKLKKIEGVGLKGGERTAVVEGTELKGDIKDLIEKVEKGASVKDTEEKAKKKKNIGPKIRGKKYQEMAKLFDKMKLYPMKDAVSLVKQTSYTKFDGTIEMHINLNIESLGGKPEFRGAVALPHGTGKEVRVVVADDKLIENVTKGIIDFDVLVSHPSMMPKLAKIARILGPKGLMPNPKTGTVTEDVNKRVKELSQGQVNFKTEPEQPIIHLRVGKVSFDEKDLIENIQAVIAAIGKSKITRITLASTMGPGIKLLLA